MFAAVYMDYRAIYPKRLIGTKQVNYFGNIVRLCNTAEGFRVCCHFN